jgi:molybdenum cofactor cytidylyltransferase
VSNKPYAALILAAGLSSRMKQFKPLLSIGSETITSRLISTFLSSEVEVYLVIGHRGNELKKSVQNLDITIIENKEYEKGMFSSIQAGVRALKPGYKAFFVSPVDIPLVRAFTIRQLIAAYDMHPGKIYYPIFGGKRGHPPLIPMTLAPAIEKWDSEGGLRALLEGYKEIALEIEVPDKYILIDIDTIEDYKELVEKFQCGGISTEKQR